MRNKREINSIHVFYRISDNGFKNKIKPLYITKENCLRNALDVFKGNDVFFHVYVDKVIKETNDMIHRLCDNRPNTNVVDIDCGSGGFSFRVVYGEACKLNDNDLVYFLEDDYLHLPGSLDVLKDAGKWNYTDYITLYDHPDKYDNHPFNVNPLCRDKGEKTIVFKTDSSHWKVTNSTTMTFAAFVNILKRDIAVFWKYTETGYPYDYNIFRELSGNGKFDILSSPIPTLSTHGETKFLAPFINWEEVSNLNR